jgi:hypothetical protein
MFEVFDTARGGLKSHGTFATLEEAYGCVRFDRIRFWLIANDCGDIVDEAED